MSATKAARYNLMTIVIKEYLTNQFSYSKHHTDTLNPTTPTLF